MNDNRLLELMDAYLDLALTEEDRRELEAALQSSPEARRLFWDYVQIHSLTGELLQEAAAAGETPRVVTEQESEWRPYPRTLWIPLAAAACLLVCVGLWILNMPPTAQARADANGNGMPDAWEIANFGGTEAEKGGPNDDYDGDGLSNLKEYLAGSSPVNKQDALRLNIANVNGQLQVSYLKRAAAGPFYAGKTRYYTLERSTSVPDGTWEPISGHSDVPGDGVVDTYRELAQNRLAFYRIRTRLQ